MLLAPALGSPPRVIAERLGDELAGRIGAGLAGWEVAGPGFLNLRLADDVVPRGRRGGAERRDGASAAAGPGRRPSGILIEFVSANPTGPLVAASGRHAAYGDSLARILAHHGHRVWREYYFNDAGNQIRLLGESVRARARGEEVPGGWLPGRVRRRSRRADPRGREPGRERGGGRRGRRSCWRRSRGHSSATGSATTRSSASGRCTTGSPSRVDQVLARLRDAGHVYHSEGADWLRTTSFGDEKDRVVLRSDGTPTYLAADIAYLDEKLERGFDRQLLPVGSDHHAYVRELEAADGGPGRRSGPARGAAAPVRPPRRRFRARRLLQAPGSVRHPRRAARRDRRRRHPLLHAPLLPRPHPRSRS